MVGWVANGKEYTIIMAVVVCSHFYGLFVVYHFKYIALGVCLKWDTTTHILGSSTQTLSTNAHRGRIGDIMKKMFIANDKVINVARGKMQWNTANETFRKDMQYRYDAAVKLADAKAQAQDDIKTINGMIEFTKKQTYVDDRVITGYETQIKSIREGISAMQREFDENAPKNTTVEENLYLAYKAYVLDLEDSVSANTYLRAFYEWADFFGMRPTEDTFKFINKKIGMKKLGAKAIVKAQGEKFTGALSKTAYLGMFYAVVMECLKAQNLLKGYEFSYKFPVKTKKTNA